MANINTGHIVIGDDTLVLQDADLRSKKVNAFQNSPDDNHYPSEKLVKDSLDAKLNNSQKGANDGLAELDSYGKVPLSQLPTLPDVSTKYDTGDTASTEIADDDYVPFYDTSASGRRKTLWSNIKAKLKSYFDSFYLTEHQDISGKANSEDLAEVAFSGDYEDLTNKPTIPAAPVNPDWNASSGLAMILNKPTINSYGFGFVNCSDASGTSALTANINGYVLNEGSFVLIRFVYGVYGGSDYTLNVNNTGRKKIMYKGAPLVDHVINALDYCLFCYDGRTYDLITIDRWNSSFDGNYNSLSNKPTIPAVVSGTNDGTNWTSLSIGDVTYLIPSGGSGGGLSNYDLTFSTLTTNTTNISFEANQQCYKRMTMTAGATLNFSIQNKGCNYLRIYNSSASDITIAIGTITYNNTAVTTKIVPDDAITVGAGKYVEIGITADASEADITVSGTLKAL